MRNSELCQSKINSQTANPKLGSQNENSREHFLRSQMITN